MSSNHDKHYAIHAVKEALHSKTGQDLTKVAVSAATAVGVPVVVATIGVPVALVSLAVWGICSIFKD